MLDLDGTLLAGEILPALAKAAGNYNAVQEMTESAMIGEDNFTSNFTSRVSMLKSLPLAAVHKTVGRIPIRLNLLTVARQWPGDVLVVTSNLDLWIAPLMADIELAFRSSTARYGHDRNDIEVLSILDKAAVVKEASSPVVFVGDGANDLDAMRQATIGVAFGDGKNFRTTLLTGCEVAFTSEGKLCRYLQRWL